ncbi:AIR synthase related protein [Solirubrobacter phytolaccae]|uniref:AIR synthase related protein n=1 Tax=Solirubrobacter phytolaccae TaxID=1404360 RepID=A0A9X3NA04_9ACTN|nr:MSMEG_0567/sll0787 family protein [Solirubrobacter phytolaccae]MDA0182528.1 AIR synthase related protein [Solirubrobacter phytolaccae]
MNDLLELLSGPAPRVGAAGSSPGRSRGAVPSPRRSAAAQPVVVEASAAQRAAYRALRRRAFVEDQGLFAGHDEDAADLDPLTIVLVAVDLSGDVLGGVRVHPEDARLGWWRGSRLVAADGRIGAQLVQAACARAATAGALRFDAHVQPRLVKFFARLGWERIRPIEAAGAPHVLMRFPMTRLADTAAVKAPLGSLLHGLLPQDRWLGDDGVPVPGTDVIACVDAIVPAMVERDPEWAGWCGMLVTAHDLSAMGAEATGALDTVGGRDAAHVEAILDGVRAGAEAFGLPILGGHTHLGVPAALSVTGLGRAPDPIPASGGTPGDAISVCADLTGGWRPGYTGRQWDSTSSRTREQLAAMLGAVRAARPHAAKDVSMAGLVGTIGMLAEASGTGATIDVAAIPKPSSATFADWLTCFPGFAVVSAGGPAPTSPETVTARCGTLTAEPGMRLRWPDGELTTALTSAPTGLGRAC